MLPGKYIVWFGDIGKDDVALVGGKGANLGEMTRAGFPVPPGFIVTAKAYFDFLHENDLKTKITHLLGTIDYNDQKSLQTASHHIKKLIQEGHMSEILISEIFKAYSRVSGIFKDALVAVRSSATAEDLAGASFAGQQETFLNVQGEATLLLRIKDVWASLFEARALFYRHEQKFDSFKVGIAVPVEKMIESDTSGIMFTIDPVTNDKTKIILDAIYGLGELIVQGAVTPDHYEVDKHTFALLTKSVERQEKKLVKKGASNKESVLPQRTGKKQKLSDRQILLLARLGKKLEDHYCTPQDIEWAIEKKKIYILQTRPITTMHAAEGQTQNTQVLPRGTQLLLQGNPASPGIASGPVKLLQSASELGRIQKGDILVAPQTNPDYVPAMKKAAGIITQTGGRTSHAAIVSRELGIPAVVGATDVMKLLHEEDVVTVNGTTGEIYKGGVKQGISVIASSETTPPLHTATKVYVNLAEPQLAHEIAKRHVDGIGLLRAEFMMAEIGIHPKKMFQEGKKKIYIETLAENIAVFAKSFSPRPVVYRASDFKTNEYRHLKGGETYEPVEANPMLGFRGAFRYIHDPELFQAELAAIQLVRNKMGFRNLWLMLPFVRTVKELQEIKKIIVDAGLYRSPTFQLWMMVEIPANVILIDKFIEAGIDGVSIGSNDLTMLTLGVDRDNTDIMEEYDEQNDAILWSMERVIKTAHKYGITSSFCGQAAMEHLGLIEKLVHWGITSISVSPDAIIQTRQHIAATEKRLLS